jgi:hypothetical protein
VKSQDVSNASTSDESVEFCIFGFTVKLVLDALSLRLPWEPDQRGRSTCRLCSSVQNFNLWRRTHNRVGAAIVHQGCHHDDIYDDDTSVLARPASKAISGLHCLHCESPSLVPAVLIDGTVPVNRAWALAHASGLVDHHSKINVSRRPLTGHIHNTKCLES